MDYADSNWTEGTCLYHWKLEIYSLYDEFATLTDCFNQVVAEKKIVEVAKFETKFMMLKSTIENSQAVVKHTLHEKYTVLTKPPKKMLPDPKIQRKYDQSLENTKNEIVEDIQKKFQTQSDQLLNFAREETKLTSESTYSELYEGRIIDLTNKVAELNFDLSTASNLIKSLRTENKESQQKIKDLDHEKQKAIEEVKWELSLKQTEIDQLQERIQSYAEDQERAIKKYTDCFGNNIKSMEIISSISKLPPVKFIKNLNVNQIPVESHEFYITLRSYLCDNLVSLNLSFLERETPADFYMEVLKDACAKTTKRVYMHYVKLNLTQLSKIVRYTGQWEELAINNSKITMDGDLYFKLEEDYKLSFIDFCNTGHPDYYNSDWITNKQDLDKIIKGMSESGLKSSLKFLGMHINYQNIIDSTQEILDSYGMNETKATDRVIEEYIYD